MKDALSNAVSGAIYIKRLSCLLPATTLVSNLCQQERGFNREGKFCMQKHLLLFPASESPCSGESKAKCWGWAGEIV